jgi:hypothetical protein
LCSRYVVLDSFKEVISGRHSGTGGVKGDIKWFEVVCEVKRGKYRRGVWRGIISDFKVNEIGIPVGRCCV